MATPTRSAAASASIAIVSLLSFLNCASVWAQTTINFDDVVDKTDIRTHYQPQGVTFGCEGAPCSSLVVPNVIYARTTNATASPPNSVSPIRDGFPGVRDSSTGRVVAAFASAVKSVSIDARAVLVPEPLNQTAFANMIAYDANNAIVASATGSQLNTFQTLTVNAPDDRIRRVSLGVTGNVAVGTFDNLQFSRDSSGGLLWFPIFFIILVALYLIFRYWKDLPRPPRPTN